jgi:phosphohistidine phosphatase
VEIWILRHASAEDRARSGRDADRSLTAEGAERANTVAKGLKRLEPQLDCVLTSPYRRARETADPAARALGLEKALRETSALEPTADPEDILGELRSAGVRGALLVGHQPHLGFLVSRLLSGRPDVEVPLQKAALVWLSWEGDGTAELWALIPPKVLERLAGLGSGL